MRPATSIEREATAGEGPNRPGGGAVTWWAAAVLALLAAGCGGGDGGDGGDDGMMNGPDRPDALVRVSAERDTVVAEETLEDPLAVRVEDASGDPLSGVDVAFEVRSGPGAVDPDTTSTDGSGEARTTFSAPNATGEATVRASVPEAEGIEPVEFGVRVVPPGLVRPVKEGGDDQEAEPGSQLPEVLAVRTLAGDNDPVGGARVVWAIEQAPEPGAGEGARLSADTVFSGPEGRARTVLTLAEAEGEHRVRAVVPGQADTVRFTAVASEGAVGGIALDSVRPVPLRAGEPATLFGSGFGDDPSAVTVTVEGVEASVMSAAGERLEMDVPSFEGRCLPARTVGVRVRDADRLGNGLSVALRPERDPLGLEPGEVRTLTRASEVECLQFAAAEDAREYRIQVQSGGRSVGRTPMRLLARSGAAPGTTPALRVVGERREAPFADREPAARASSRELELKRNIREKLRRIGARPARDESPSEGRRVRAAHRSGPPSVGDTIGINFYVRDDLTITCSDTLRRIGAEVRAVGERVVLAEDTLARKAEGFDDADYARLRDEFDRTIFAVDSAYFGAPSDIDHNDRVVVLITPEVNLLTPAEESAIVIGFFSSADLADSGDPEGGGTLAGGACSTSNEGEILYLLAPDPGGEQWGHDIGVNEGLQLVRGTSAHEQQHLINASIRLIRENGGFGDLIDTWLDEGLSHVAEEVVGFHLQGLEPRENAAFEEAGGGSEIYEAFFFQNLGRLSSYYGNPSDTRALATSDPGGVESLEMRGFAWSFLRWLADTRVPDGGGGFLGGPREEELFRALAEGGPELLGGVDNVLRAVDEVSGTRPTWGELVSEFSPVAHVDDDVEGVPDRFTFPSWDLRDQYASLNSSSGYPLRVTEAEFEPTAYEFEVRGATQVYFRFGAAEAPAFSLKLTSRVGGPVPSGAVPQITVVRSR